METLLPCPITTAEGTIPLNGSYEPLPSLLEIRTSITSGRGIWTKSKFQAGSVLISLRPEVVVLSNQYLDSHCSTCSGAAPAAGLKRCTQCRTIWYCNNICQMQDWVLHKHECSALKRWAESAPSPDLSIPNEAVRGLGRILWMRRKLGVGNPWVRDFDMMQSHRSSLLPSSFEVHSHLAHSLVRYLNLLSPIDLHEFGFSSVGDLVDLTSRFITNTFTLTSPSLTPLGISVSPQVALINHSCDPNAVIVFPHSARNPLISEPLMQVIALRTLDPNQEILTSYIDTTLPQASRQKSLQETYYFSCSCNFCTNRPNPDPRESLWCPKSCGGLCSMPMINCEVTRCSKCNATVSSTDKVLDNLRLGEEVLDRATSLQFSDPSKAKYLIASIIPILSSLGLTPSSHPLLALTRLHQSLLIESLAQNVTQDILNEIIRTAAKSLAGLSSILSQGHPVRGVALAELGKMLAVDEPEPSPSRAANAMFPPSGPPRLRLALETLIKARDELLIGFGLANEGGEVGREVRESIVSLEKELGIWSQSVRNVLEDMPAENIRL